MRKYPLRKIAIERLSTPESRWLKEQKRNDYYLYAFAVAWCGFWIVVFAHAAGAL